MGALEKFLGAPKEVEIDGVKLILLPLKVKDMATFSKNNPTEEEAKEIGRKIMLLSIKDSTPEEIDELPLDIFTKIMDEINQLNGFTDENASRINKFAQQRNTTKKSN